MSYQFLDQEDAILLGHVHEVWQSILQRMFVRTCVAAVLAGSCLVLEAERRKPRSEAETLAIDGGCRSRLPKAETDSIGGLAAIRFSFGRTKSRTSSVAFLYRYL